MTVAIDFDGTIHDIDHPVEGRQMGPPLKGAKAALEALRSEGEIIIIHTVRGNKPQHVKDWMEFYKIPFDFIAPKILADVYIDDRGLRFMGDWDEILDELETLDNA